MTLLQKRIDFTGDVGMLIVFARTWGFNLVLCEALRSVEGAKWNATHCRQVVDGKRCAQPMVRHEEAWAKSGGVPIGHTFKPIGSAKSLHINGLAVDFLLMEDGEIVNDVEPYKRLGEFWKGLREGNCWGGDFKGFADLGHFSREHDGKK